MRALGPIALAAGLWLATATPVHAQAPRPAPPRPAPTRPAPVPPEPSVSFRFFAMGTVEWFTASTSFNAVYEWPVEPFIGAGVQLTFLRNFFVEGTVSAWQRTGERAFVNNGEVFPLGIPLKGTLLPIEGGIGYRFHRGRKLRPYATVGGGWYTYIEDLNTQDEAFFQHAGFLGNVGVEYRLRPKLLLTGDLQGTYVPGILGAGGVSEIAGETDLGGIAGRVRLIFGR